MTIHRAVKIVDSTGPGEARRVATRLGERAGFDDSDIGRIALIVTEVCTNIAKHVGRGQVLLRQISVDEGGPGIEILALDKGNGMQDVSLCLRDGYSTAGSPGTGLGAISRLATSWDLYTQPRLGTAILARVHRQKRAETATRRRKFDSGFVRVAAPGETQCGDDWSMRQSDEGTVVLVVDGLGHGPEAAKAAETAIRVLRDPGKPEEILGRVHIASQATRGVAASCAEIDVHARSVTYAGVGNVAGLLAWSGGSKSLVGQNGTLGVQIGRLRAISYPWVRNASLIMYTDGLTTHANPQNYPGLLVRDPTLVASVLYRDFSRNRDDATVLVVREAREKHEE